MSSLDVPGARLHCETRGSGPLLLLIPGAPGVGAIFAALATGLSDHYTVVSYDRRGFSRSYLTGPQDYSRRLRTDADDARRLIEHLTDEPATVFGSSSGAVVALRLLTDHPGRVCTIIPYEPSTMRLLSDGGQNQLDFCGRLYDRYRLNGPGPALAEFREHFFPECDHAVMNRPVDPDTAPQIIANTSYWFERELCSYNETRLDEALLSAYAERVVPAVGRASSGFPTYEIGIALGELLGRSTLQLPGGHTGYITDTAEFAAELIAEIN